MGKLTPAFFVGLMVIAGAGVFIYMFGAVDKSATTHAKSYGVSAVLDDVSGLAVQSRVTMSGIPVGQIDRIELDPVTKTKARVLLRIDKTVTLFSGEPGPGGRVVSGAVLTRRQASLLGDYYLEITPGVAGQPLRDGDAIPTVVSVSGIAALLEQMERQGDLFGRIDRIAANIEAVTRSLAEVVGGDSGARRLDTVLADIAVATDNIAVTTGELKTFLRDTLVARQGSFDRIIGNVEQFTGDAARISGQIDRSIGRSLGNIEAITTEIRGLTGRSAGRIDELMAKAGAVMERVEASLVQIQGSIASLDGTLGHAREIARKVDEGEGTIGRLVNDPTLAEGIEEVVDDVGSLVRSVSRLQVRVDLRVEYGFLEGTTKTYFGLRLQPKADRWYQLEIIDDPRGKTSFSTRLTETNDPSLPPVLRETTTTTTDDLKFSVYFAKRFHFLTARLGIMESTGGAGLDFSLLDDALRFSVDTFELGMDRIPRVKTTATVTLFDHLVIMGGVDDIFDDGQRDYFAGLGLTFTDEDLKALLMIAPTPSF